MSHPQDAKNQPETDEAGKDVQSDPALDDGTSTDWSSEGGATDNGPATSEDDDD